MSRYVDADQWLKEIECGASLYEFLKAEIPYAPSIDIVRCRECKHWCNGDDVHGICYRCPNTRQMRYDDFCSYGEVSEKPTGSEKPNNSTTEDCSDVGKE